MTWRPHLLPPVPEATAAVVKAAFPKGNLYVDLRTEIGTLYEQDLCTDLYANRGHPIEVAPWRLALVTVMQYIEGLTDRQAAEAMRRCIDWKYALRLELTDAGFHFTLLHDFRPHLLAHGGTQRLLDIFLEFCKARGWMKTRGAQPTDSTHMLGPTLVAGDVVLMDNLSAHKVAGIREAIEGHGAQVIYLPPYTPDLSPIEPCWSKVKTALRKAKTRTREALEHALEEVLSTVTAVDAHNWFAHCGYSVQ
jgi:transposase